MAEPNIESLHMMYGTLRKEIEDFLKEIGILVTSSIMASGAGWGWILVNQEKVVSKGLLFIPGILVFLAAMRAHALREGTVRAADHLARLEHALGFDNTLGWHIRWQNELSVRNIFSWSKLNFNLRSNPLAPWLYLFWFSILVINLLPAVLLCVR
jgi:hypothetical protein